MPTWQPSAHRLARGLTLPGTDSLRGRYVYVAALFCLFLLGAAWFAQRLVETSSDDNLRNIHGRVLAAEKVHDLMERVREVETAVQRAILLPEVEHRVAVRGALDLFDREVKQLPDLAWTGQSAILVEHSQQLARDIERLRAEAETLVAVRADVTQWFPAITILTERVLPQNTAALTAATLALEETYDRIQGPGQQEAYRLYADIRHAWIMVIAEFRLYLANRFGIYSDPNLAMKAQVANIALYAETIDRLLARLAELDRQGLLNLQASESLVQLRQLRKTAFRSMDDTFAVLTSKQWRRDLPLLTDRIDPLLAGIRTTLHAIETELERLSLRNTAGLAQTAAQVTHAIWLLALVGIVLTIAGFLVFHYTVLAPIARVAGALKAEARGSDEAKVPRTSTVETRNLIEAFDQMRHQVHIRQQRLENILDHAAEGVITINHKGVIQTFNRAAEKLFGYREDEVVGRNVSLLMPTPQRERHDGYLERHAETGIKRIIGKDNEQVAQRKDGTTFPIALKVSESVLRGKSIYTGLIEDISERKAMLQNLKYMAERDGLTGLYNRSYFHTELERVVARARHLHGASNALLYIDLDNFKYVNDTMGHMAGDRLLVEVTAILRKRARQGDLFARFGGDEFTVLLYDTDAETARRVAEAFRAQLADFVFTHGAERADVASSVGIALITPETRSADDALSQADLACHLAKRAGRNRVYLFDPMDAGKVASMSLDMGWSRRIKEAIAQDRFVLACQPIVGTRSRRVESYEVLIRMLDENNEHIMPNGFLPSAERFGLSTEIDKWVIVNTIETLAAQHLRLPDLRYCINLSAQTLTDTGVCDLIDATLRANGVKPARLTFEVTETAAIADMTMAQGFLARLKAMGCRTALDDFGSGFTSFAYLKDLPVDLIKIDGRYVRNLPENAVDQAMVKAINEIVHVMGKQTVAEYVENEAILTLLAEYGVDFAQGYHLGRPDQMGCRAIAAHAGVSSQ